MLKALQVVVCGYCLLIISIGASAQPAPRLSGVVRDTTASVLPGVTVAVTGAATVSPRTLTTDVQGRYELDALPAGRYLVTATLVGFDPQTISVDVTSDPAVVDLVLSLSPLSERVTVTATRTGAADIQTTPLAVTTLAASTLDQMGIRTVEGLAGVVPSVTISQQNGAAQVTIRGIGTNSIVVGSDPSSTVHLDGVYLGRPVMVLSDFLDVERVEVLRGPQGTLYGRNSVGGTINVVTRQPTNALDTSVRLTAGNYDTLRAEAAVSGPLVKDKVMGTVAFLRSGRDGFVQDLDHPDHRLGSEDTWAGRGQLRVVLGNKGELLLSGDYGRFDGVPLTYAKPIAAKPGFSYDSPSSLWAVRASHEAHGKNTQQGSSARLTVRLNPTTTLTSLTAYRDSDYRFFVDADATELRLQTSDVPDIHRQFSQEFTVVQRHSKLTWIGGAFFYDDHNEGRVEITVFPVTQIRPFAQIGTDARALFGQATYSLTDRVSVTGGVRYTHERKDLDTTGGVYRIGTDILLDPTSFYDFVETATFDAWTPKLSLQFQASPRTFAYLSATRGFKSGGFNPAARKPEVAGFDPEFAWSYEGGVKHTMAAGRLGTNLAVFHTDYRDLQVLSFLQPGVPHISNAGAATIRGVEVEVDAAAGHGLHLAGHISWLDATYDRYLALQPAGAPPRDAAGNRLNNTPEWSGSGSAVYEFAAWQRGKVRLRGDVSWQSRVFFTPFNTPIETQADYGLVRLRAGFEPRSARWELAVYVRNVGNMEYITGTGNAPIPAFSARPGDPRHWGTQFTFRP